MSHHHDHYHDADGGAYTIAGWIARDLDEGRVSPSTMRAMVGPFIVEALGYPPPPPKVRKRVAR
jgi:hypothetical protein